MVSQSQHLHRSSDNKPGILNLFGKPAYPVVCDTEIEATEKLIAKAKGDLTSGISFTEVMSGFIHIGDDVKDFDRNVPGFDLATKIARSNCEAARFFLSVKTWNTDDCKSIINNSRHETNFRSGE
jgi:hypothetical protein